MEAGTGKYIEHVHVVPCTASRPLGGLGGDGERQS